MYQYLIKLQDMLSTPAMQMAARWNNTLAGMDRVQQRVVGGMQRGWQKIGDAVRRSGGTINDLRKKIEDLHKHRDGLDVRLDASGIRTANRQIDDLERKLNRLTNKKTGGGGGGSGLLMAGGVAGMVAYGAIEAGKAALGATVSPAMDLQSEQYRMGVMLKSQPAAEQLVGQGRQFAKDTLFNTPEVVGAQRMLLSFGETSGRVMPILKMLGDVSAMTGNKLGDMVPILGKIKATGHLQGDEMNQFSERGLNLRPYIAKAMQVKESQLAKLQEAGKISYQHILEAFRLMTSGDGIYADGSSKVANNTTEGRYQKLMGEFEERLADLGLRALPMVNKVLEYTGTLMDRIAPLGEPILRLVGAFSPLVSSIGGLLQSLGLLDAQGQISQKFIGVLTVYLDALGKVLYGISWVVGKVVDLISWAIAKIAEMPLFKLIGAMGGPQESKAALVARRAERNGRLAVVDPASATALGGAGAGGGKSLGKAAGIDATVGGAAKKYITVNVKSLIEKSEIHVATLNEGVQDLEAKIIDALLRAVNSATAMSS